MVGGYKKAGFSEAAAVAKEIKEEAGEAKKGFIDLKRSKKEAKKESMPMASSSYDDYPYGLRLDFNADIMKKLGMAMPTVGKEMTLVIKAKVVRAEQSESEDGGPRKSCCLQITKVKL